MNFLKKNGVKDDSIAILHCVLSYPTKDIDANLQFIDLLKKKFPKNYIGYSDHTMPDYGMTSLVSAFIKGACILEKHYTYNKRLKGNDHYHSMDMDDLEKFNFILNQIDKKVKESFQQIGRFYHVKKNQENMLGGVCIQKVRLIKVINLIKKIL